MWPDNDGEGGFKAIILFIIAVSFDFTKSTENFTVVDVAERSLTISQPSFSSIIVPVATCTMAILNPSLEINNKKL